MSKWKQRTYTHFWKNKITLQSGPDFPFLTLDSSAWLLFMLCMHFKITNMPKEVRHQSTGLWCSFFEICFLSSSFSLQLKGSTLVTQLYLTKRECVPLLDPHQSAGANCCCSWVRWKSVILNEMWNWSTPSCPGKKLHCLLLTQGIRCKGWTWPWICGFLAVVARLQASPTDGLLSGYFILLSHQYALIKQCSRSQSVRLYIFIIICWPNVQIGRI